MGERETSVESGRGAAEAEGIARLRALEEVSRLEMVYERRSGGHFAAESRAAYLAQLGRLEESLLAYEELSARESLSEPVQERVRQNINRLRAQLA